MRVNYPNAAEPPEPMVGELKILESALSHDVEGSVRGIKTLVSILVRKHGSTFQGEASDLVQLLSTEAERASRLLDSLMDWLNHAQQSWHFAWEDPARISRETFAEVSATFPERHVDFRVPALPLLWSDPIALRKIFRELFSNALKFTDNQSAPIVSLSAVEGERDTVLTVRDNGVGFDASHSEQLFKLFRRMHRRREFPGEGAGLAIVRQIMQRHGGRVWAEAQIDQGTAIHLVFPKPTAVEPRAPYSENER